MSIAAFSAKTFIWYTDIYFFHLRKLSNRFWASWQNISHGSLKVVSPPESKTTFWEIVFFSKILRFSVNFGHWVNFFRPDCRNFSAALSKLLLICPIEHFPENGFLIKNTLSSFFGQWVKTNGSPAPNFCWDRQQSILRQSQKERFEGKFFLWKTYLFIVSGPWANSSEFLLNVFFWQSWQKNFIVRVHSSIFSKNVNLQTDIYFLHLRKLSDWFSASWPKLSPGSSKLVFLAESNTMFWGKFFSQKYYFFLLVFDLELNFSGLLAETFHRGCHHWFLFVQLNILGKKILIKNTLSFNLGQGAKE